MNKTDKEYIDAQIASIEKKLESRINETTEQTNESSSFFSDLPDLSKFPLRITRKGEELTLSLSRCVLEAIGSELLLEIEDQKIRRNNKAREEGQMIQEDCCIDIYNKNIENWKKIHEFIQEDILKRKPLIEDICRIKNNMNAFKHYFDSMSQSIELITKNNKPTGVYIFGKHIAGCYYIAFMILLVTFLGCFAFGFFKMKEDVALANEKIRIISIKHGHDPAVKKTFEMIDSLHTSQDTQTHS